MLLVFWNLIIFRIVDLNITFQMMLKNLYFLRPFLYLRVFAFLVFFIKRILNEQNVAKRYKWIVSIVNQWAK